MSKISPLAPLLDIHSLPLDEVDLIVDQIGHVTPDVDAKFLQSFDAAWCNIMDERGSFNGKHESKIAILQNIAVKLKKSKDDVKSELKTQTLFVRNNRDAMESKFEHQIQEVKNLKTAIDEKLNKKMNGISQLMKVAETTMHWQLFIRKTDSKPSSDSSQLNKTAATACHNDIAKRLVCLYQDIDKKTSDADIVEQRTTKVENVLLQSQLKMLRLELDRCKAATMLQQELSATLKEVHKA